ncbi:hypothetical protein HPP92_002138 [Vanilla planifolia]|uniref:Uncharacterized protein n=1 Tax=Vanilla planifolia TaxID=51239 RepID=A0A835S954_VANPL|nr:hypothetical protein HPP92_002429 [Vanilla planifolia]KAG0502066.1 hypothetical protein HPP92_002138 [Vanilla planifolia]
MVICSLASGLFFGHPANGVMTTLCFFRFWLGDLGFSAVVSSRWSSRFDALFKGPPYNINPADYVWRIILMLGAAPAALTYYWRLKMPETARYTALVANAKQVANDMAKDHRLLRTTTTWLLLDIAFYSQNLFQKDIFGAIGWIPKANTMNALEELSRISKVQPLIALCSTVPGCWFTVSLIDIIRRFWIHMMGIFFMTVFMLGLAIPQHHWTEAGHRVDFVVMYAFTFFFGNFGPHSPAFVVQAEIFPQG